MYKEKSQELSNRIWEAITKDMSLGPSLLEDGWDVMAEKWLWIRPKEEQIHALPIAAYFYDFG